MRLAHFGHFDTEGYGDQLESLLLRQRLSDLFDEVIDVSPVGGPPVWPGSSASISIAEAVSDERGFDAVILGGPRLIDPSGPWAELERPTQFVRRLGEAALWVGAAHLADSTGARLCLNAAEAPTVLGREAGLLMRRACLIASYASVRDASSLETLRAAAVTKAVAVVPHLALGAPRLGSAGELAALGHACLEEAGLDQSESYIVLHVTGTAALEPPRELARQLDRVSEHLSARPVLVAWDGCDRDDGLMISVAPLMTSGPVVVDRLHGALGIVAIIANARAFLGSSLESMLTACAFATPACLVGAQLEAHPSGLGTLPERLGLDRWHAPSWENAEARAQDLCAEDQATWGPISVETGPLLDAHWERLREAVSTTARGRRGRLLIGRGRRGDPGLRAAHLAQSSPMQIAALRQSIAAERSRATQALRASEQREHEAARAAQKTHERLERHRAALRRRQKALEETAAQQAEFEERLARHREAIDSRDASLAAQELEVEHLTSRLAEQAQAAAKVERARAGLEDRVNADIVELAERRDALHDALEDCRDMRERLAQADGKDQGEQTG